MISSTCASHVVTGLLSLMSEVLSAFLFSWEMWEVAVILLFCWVVVGVVATFSLPLGHIGSILNLARLILLHNPQNVDFLQVYKVVQIGSPDT